MATKAQLKKSAVKLGVVEELEKLGFALGPDDFWFYRQRGEFIDTIFFWLNSSGNYVQIPVSTWVKEIVYFADMKNFPKGFIKNASCVSGMSLGKDKVDYATNFSVQNTLELEEFFQLFVENVSKYAISWFDQIQHREDIFTNYNLAEGPVAAVKGFREAIYNRVQM